MEAKSEGDANTDTIERTTSVSCTLMRIARTRDALGSVSHQHRDKGYSVAGQLVFVSIDYLVE
jgi:hypothetical protein